jgi:hypothetical protein
VAKLTFEDSSFIEIRKSETEIDKILIIIHAKDEINPLKRTINTVEITLDQFKQLTSGVL